MKKLIQTLTSFRLHFRKAVQGHGGEFTDGSIRKAIFYLAIPMILEMIMESLFAVVDIFFVGRIGVNAVATVGLTESVLTIIYSISIGISMAGTAIVARRIGEKNHREASIAAFQVIFLGTISSLVIGLAGFIYAEDILRLMGADEAIIAEGAIYTKIIFGGNISVMLLFLINGVFRGAGQAAIAMKSLWLANGINIVLDPILIFGIAYWDGFGIAGAAMATTIGRSFGVLYQFYHLLFSSELIKITKETMIVTWDGIKNIVNVSIGGMSQFLIESASWIFLVRFVSEFGSNAVAGYTIAIRILIFTLLPAFGLANAAATLVGQNLGAGKPERAEASVWKSAKYNAYFLGICSILFVIFGDFIVGLFNTEPDVVRNGQQVLFIVCLGYVFFAYGMVISQSFNGAGDTYTPMRINIVLFWIIEIPLAWFLAFPLGIGLNGIFWAIAIAHSLHAVVSVWLFKKGRWKTISI